MAIYENVNTTAMKRELVKMASVTVSMDFPVCIVKKVSLKYGFSIKLLSKISIFKVFVPYCAVAMEFSPMANVIVTRAGKVPTATCHQMCAKFQTVTNTVTVTRMVIVSAIKDLRESFVKKVIHFFVDKLIKI